jgi:DNA/RNA endonuclease YhcR with UshA esterase domain
MKMNILIKFTLAAVLLLAVNTITNSQDTISSKDAKNFIGVVKIVKGPVAGIFKSNKGTVLFNFDEDHPNATFVAVIKNTAEISYSEVKIGSILTISGMIEDYKGKPEIIITEQSQILKVE